MQSAVHLALCLTEQMQICHHSMRRVFFNQIRVQAFFQLCLVCVCAHCLSGVGIELCHFKRMNQKREKKLGSTIMQYGKCTHTAHSVDSREEKKKWHIESKWIERPNRTFEVYFRCILEINHHYMVVLFK